MITSDRPDPPHEGNLAMSVDAELLHGPGVDEWNVWTTDARLVVTDPKVVRDARAMVDRLLAQIDLAASRFRPDSEVCLLAARQSDDAAEISPLLAGLLELALEAARRTDGDVDPTLGNVLVGLGYDRDLSAVVDASDGPRGGRVVVRRAGTWRDVHLEGTRVRLPAGVLLDLGATAKARAVDICAREIADRFGCGALLSLGGDLRVAGPPPSTGWQVLVQDAPDEPSSHVQLREAQAIASSSTLHRVWQDGQRQLHHIIDPQSLQPSEPVWRTVTVAASTCVEANTLSTAAIVRGRRAADLLIESGVAARLVARDGSVELIGGWPA